MSTPPRRADEHLRWLRAVMADRRPEVGPLLGLGALTGTDHRALEAIDRCWDLYCSTGSENVLTAVRALLAEMQECTRPFARALIARSLDWGDIARLWPKVDDEALKRSDDERAASLSRIVQSLEGTRS